MKYEIMKMIFVNVFLIIIIVELSLHFPLLKPIEKKDYGMYSTPNVCKVHIPSYSEMDTFCKERGFQTGFMSGTCKADQVMCSKQQTGNLYEYTCITWE